MCIHWHKTFDYVPKFYDLMTLTLRFDLLLKNLGDSFLMGRVRVFMFHMCIPCDKNFHAVPLVLT